MAVILNDSAASAKEPGFNPAAQCCNIMAKFASHVLIDTGRVRNRSGTSLDTMCSMERSRGQRYRAQHHARVAFAIGLPNPSIPPPLLM